MMEFGIIFIQQRNSDIAIFPTNYRFPIIQANIIENTLALHLNYFLRIYLLQFMFRFLSYFQWEIKLIKNKDISL